MVKQPKRFSQVLRCLFYFRAIMGSNCDRGVVPYWTIAFLNWIISRLIIPRRAAAGLLVGPYLSSARIVFLWWFVWSRRALNEPSRFSAWAVVFLPGLVHGQADDEQGHD